VQVFICLVQTTVRNIHPNLTQEFDPGMRSPVSCRYLVALFLLMLLLFSLMPLVNPLLYAESAPWPTHSIREPVWAGRFYPAGPKALRHEIRLLMRKAAALEKGAKNATSDTGRLCAVVFPHAGYGYSGVVAARSALEIEKDKDDFSTAIIMGPDHRVGFRNVALSEKSAWATPLGIIGVSPRAGLLRKEKDIFRPVEMSDQTEHSIEVVLPFLQVIKKDFEIIPLVVGPCNISTVSRALDPMLDEHTLVVVSSDLSHFLTYDQAVKQDRATLQGIVRLDPTLLRVSENRACGKYPLMVLLDLAKRHGWKPELLLYRNSGDITGERSRVVGYASIAFYEQARNSGSFRHISSTHGPVNHDQTDRGQTGHDQTGGKSDMNSSDKPRFLTQQQGIALTRLARQTIAAAFEGKEVSSELPPELQAPELQEERGTFVTLTKHGMLRGCIGNILPQGSIIESVKRNALNAAFRDFRFPPLTHDELHDIHIEVSILTLPKRLEYLSADDLIHKLKPGVHGVIIKEGMASATFLPQVWEQLPSPEEFLTRLCLKAGLPGNEWKTGRLEVETYEVQYFDEPEGHR